MAGQETNCGCCHSIFCCSFGIVSAESSSEKCEITPPYRSGVIQSTVGDVPLFNSGVPLSSLGKGLLTVVQIPPRATMAIKGLFMDAQNVMKRFMFQKRIFITELLTFHVT